MHSYKHKKKKLANSSFKVSNDTNQNMIFMKNHKSHL
jgi:hypothetical protein